MHVARTGFGVVILLVLGGCGSQEKPQESVASLTVTVVTVTAGVVEQWATLTGTCEARDEAVAAVEGVGGRIMRLGVEIGDHVSAGQEVAIIDDVNVRMRQDRHAADVVRAQATRAQVAAQVIEAEADAAETARSVERLAALAAERAVAAETIGTKKALQLAAAARVTASKAALAAAAADQTRLAHIGEELSLAQARTRIIAPVAGLVATRPVKVGQIVSGGDVVVSIAVDGLIEFAAEVPESVVMQVAVGAPVVLTNGPSSSTGKVRRVDPVVDRMTRLGAIRVELLEASASEKSSLALRLGTSASARVRIAQATGLVVPLTALVRARGQTNAVVVAADGRAQRVPATIGVDDGVQAIVVHGLTAGQQVVARAPGFVADGARVLTVSAGVAPAALPVAPPAAPPAETAETK